MAWEALPPREISPAGGGVTEAGGQKTGNTMEAGNSAGAIWFDLL
jgi:hypothetical protein